MNVDDYNAEQQVRNDIRRRERRDSLKRAVVLAKKYGADTSAALAIAEDLIAFDDEVL